MSGYLKIAIVTQLILAVALGAFASLGFTFIAVIATAFRSNEEAERFRKKIKADFLKSIAYSIGFFFAVFMLADGAIFALPYVLQGYLRLLGWLGVQVAQTLIAGGIVLLGYGAYKFKRATQKYYGLVEVLFSAVSVIVALKTTKPDNRLGLVATLIGAIYVSSRGFANYFKKE